MTTVLCELISLNEFTIKDDRSLFKIFTGVQGHKYNGKEKEWIFPLKEYHSVLEQVKKEKPNLLYREIPKLLLDTFLSLKPLPHVDINKTNIPKTLLQKLMPFQIEGVRYSIQKQGKIAICDQMGLGKSVQALAVALHYKREWPLLIISPSSLLSTWEQMIKDWVSMPVEVGVIYESKNASFDSEQIYVISYDLAVKLSDKVAKKKFEVIIVDECHYLKNANTKRTKTLLPIIQKAERRILLSGTPALSRPMELFTQLQIIQPALFKNFFDYGARYCAAFKSHFGWNFKGASNVRELQVILENLFMIRRLKDQVLSQLPPKRRQQRKDYPKSQTLESLLNSKNGLESEINDNSLLTSWKETAAAKLPSMINYVEGLVESGHKLLLFAHHRDIMDEFEKRIIEKKINYIRIDGSTATNSRFAKCDEFQKKEDIKVALLSITAASVGLTLTSATTVVFAELYWNPGVLVQAEDRARRIGQKDSVNVHFLLAKGTLDDIFWPLILKKLDILESVGLSKNEFALTTQVEIDEKGQQHSNKRKASFDKSIKDYFVKKPLETIELSSDSPKCNEIELITDDSDFEIDQETLRILDEMDKKVVNQ
ncbi:SNF2-related domain-containing protein [Rozella allomycis CSF55]|uniref:SNF2-related domain-containing protein n=1 Tax=Rozella allomycis (strain CSF55) TaxID=988480 RepID=A0A075ASR6_ROZAC|nr:SNF2-related domain-containing protein [Rozella allomycis CSF55]|eukprot:EPZ31756.1 SNF2-related domain-containing protein [Rozella allomycis CSF55]